MSKFTSIITVTFPSPPLFKEWYKTIEEFFLKDEKVTLYLKQNGMTKWTMSKTDDVEPVKVIIFMEYMNKESFEKCQSLFLKYMPKVQNLIYKTNIIRGEVLFDQI